MTADPVNFAEGLRSRLPSLTSLVWASLGALVVGSFETYSSCVVPASPMELRGDVISESSGMLVLGTCTSMVISNMEAKAARTLAVGLAHKQCDKERQQQR